MYEQNIPGRFVISLDLELMWGMFDKVTVQEYGKNIAAVHEVVPKLLDLFEQYDIHATWAVVGMLMCQNEQEWRDCIKANLTPPDYVRHELSSYEHGNKTDLDKQSLYYFAPSLVQKISTAPNQELASHTFSHFYCLEEQADPHDAFAADCQMFTTVSAEYQQPIRSIVFPRNQWTQGALKTALESGIGVYRGTERHPFYRARSDRRQTNPLIRALRLIDNYLNLSGFHTYLVDTDTAIINIPSSRFLRPYTSKLWFLEPLRLRRIKKAMTHAAKHGEVFHLWWHPHNFGAKTEKNFAFLIKILEHYRSLNERYGLQSATMYEAATQSGERNASSS